MKFINQLNNCNPEEAIILLKKDIKTYKILPSNILNDRKVVTFLAKKNGAYLKYVSKDYYNDKEIMLLAIKSSSIAYQWLGEDLKNDKEFALAAMNTNGTFLRVFSTTIRDNKEIVLAAVSNVSHALKYASLRLRDDEEVVCRAVENDVHTYALEYVSDRLKNKKEIILKAFQTVPGYKDSHTIQSEGLDFIIEFAQNYGLELNCLSKENKSNKKIVLGVIHWFPFNIANLDENLQKDWDIVKTALRNSSVFKVCHDDIKKNKDVALHVVKRNYELYKELPLKLKKDNEIILEMLKKLYGINEDNSIKIEMEVHELLPKSIKIEIGDNDALEYFKSKLESEYLKNLLPNNNHQVAKMKI